jgi:uncharacterized lipoprotein YbaY
MARRAGAFIDCLQFAACLYCCAAVARPAPAPTVIVVKKGSRDAAPAPTAAVIQRDAATLPLLGMYA